MQLNSETISNLILRWYDEFGRKQLPWRQNLNTYQVWLSEIMLQQTQVVTVIPYFQRFIDRFPNLETLAEATISEVLTYWSGLGYYARARNLHRTAQIIHQQFAGCFPKEVKDLEKLPGIGRSTAGAISAIAFKQVAPILDGNVKRVLTRLYGVKGWPGEPGVAQKLWQISESLLPKQRIDDYTQALMDLGAMICTRHQPKCQPCPIKQFCFAYQQNCPEQYPTAKPKRKLPSKSVYLLMIENTAGLILLQKRPPIGIWGGLWTLPECPYDEDIFKWCFLQFGFKVKKIEAWPCFTHTFTHFHLKISPIKLQLMDRPADKIMENTEVLWYKLNQCTPIAVPAPVKRLLTQLGEVNDAQYILPKTAERS